MRVQVRGWGLIISEHKRAAALRESVPVTLVHNQQDSHIKAPTQIQSAPTNN